MPQGLSDSTWVLDLPYVKPLLSANRKVHYQQQARVTKQIINDVRWLVKAARIPALGKCRVQFHWEPTAPARRDTDNLAPFLKPVYDALVLEGVVVDDAPAFMQKPEPIIHPWSKRRTFPLRRVMWLVITDQSHLEHVQIVTSNRDVVRNDWVEPLEYEQ